MAEIALIFDLDGLLADTEKLQILAYQDVFKSYNLQLSDENYEDHWIRKGLGIKEYVELNDISISYTELRLRKKLIYEQLIDRCMEPMPFAIETVKYFHLKRKIAIASS